MCFLHQSNRKKEKKKIDRLAGGGGGIYTLKKKCGPSAKVGRGRSTSKFFI